MYKHIYYGIKNLFQYLPIIWNDRDWDHYYLLHLLEYKLKRMSEYHIKHGITANKAQTARQLKICQLLCKRIKEDDYIQTIDIPQEWLGYFPQLTGAQKKTITIRWDKAIRQQQADIRYLTRIINKHLLSWWD